jgi:hypothetical protein
MLDFEVQLLSGLSAAERDGMLRGISILEKALGVLDP